MDQDASAQAAFNALDKEFREYVGKLKVAWFSQNRKYLQADIFGATPVYEVMSPQERDRVHRLIAQWGIYITPIAEAWWKERGYAVLWPDDDSQPMKFRKLSTA